MTVSRFQVLADTIQVQLDRVDEAKKAHERALAKLSGPGRMEGVNEDRAKAAEFQLEHEYAALNRLYKALAVPDPVESSDPCAPDPNRYYVDSAVGIDEEGWLYFYAGATRLRHYSGDSAILEDTIQVDLGIPLRPGGDRWLIAGGDLAEHARQWAVAYRASRPAVIGQAQPPEPK